VEAHDSEDVQVSYLIRSLLHVNAVEQHKVKCFQSWQCGRRGHARILLDDYPSLRMEIGESVQHSSLKHSSDN
jgi:hypothetical protein